MRMLERGLLLAMWVCGARVCVELEFRFKLLGDVRWGEGCGELLLGEWGRVMVVCAS